MSRSTYIKLFFLSFVSADTTIITETICDSHQGGKESGGGVSFL